MINEEDDYEYNFSFPFTFVFGEESDELEETIKEEDKDD